METKKLNLWEKFVAYTTEESNWLLHIMLGVGICCELLTYQRHAVLQLVIGILGTFGIAWFFEYGQKFLAKILKEILAKFGIKKDISSVPSRRDAIITGVHGGIIGCVLHFVLYNISFDSATTRNDFLETPYYIGIILISVSSLIWFIKLGITIFKKKENDKNNNKS